MKKWINTNGYVLVYVGTNHHLAYSTGYAYEHRLVAEKVLGRRLKPGELVHHKDGDRANNASENLEVLHAPNEHRYLHRKHNYGRRKPGEPNRIVSCLCGCGERFRRFDKDGRRRRYTSGHNARSAKIQEKVIEMLARGPVTRRAIMDECGVSHNTAANVLWRFHQMGIIRKVALWTWGSTGKIMTKKQLRCHREKLSGARRRAER